MPDKKCWKVHVKKNRYVKRKECQKCNRWQEKYTTKQKKKNCKLVPRQECRTIYFNDCKKIPQKSCKTKYRNNCKKVQNCETKYNTHCTKPKPTYGKPTYGAPKEVCEQVPYEKCSWSKKCDKVPDKQITIVTIIFIMIIMPRCLTSSAARSIGTSARKFHNRSVSPSRTSSAPMCGSRCQRLT